MKKQILLMFTVMMAICSYGQSWKILSRDVAPEKSVPAMIQKQLIEATGNQFWWGYFSADKADDLPYSGNLGYNSAVTVDAAIYVPANHSIVGQGTIKALRFWLGDDISGISNDLTVWISSNLPSSASEADYSQTVAKGNLVSRLNEVELTTPFSVNNAGFYVGFSFNINKKAYPIMSYGEEDIPNAFFFRITGQNWMDFPALGYGYGVLALQMLVDGVELPSYNVSVSDFETSYVLKGGKVNVPITITNGGKETVSSIAYTITTDGNTIAEKTLSVKNLPPFGSTTLSIPFDADKDNKKYSKTLTVTKVNDQSNTATQNSSNGSLITISEKPVAVPVVEEFTGTWCGYCPYGMVGLAKAHETFGDKVVLIAVHNDDPMAINDYNPIMSRVSGFPSSFINRVIDAYPSVGTLQYHLQSSMERITVGSIEASAIWTSDAKTEISIDTQTKFVYTDDNGQYGIAYVLVADGLKGTGSNWSQSNYLSGGSGDDSMTFWYNSASKVSGLEYNHVAVGAWGIANGVNGSVNNNIKAGEVQNYNFKADITSKSVIQDKSKLTVVTLLIDKSTGNIVNAAQTTINDSGEASGIETIENSNIGKAKEIYSLDGRRLNAAQKGVNIVKFEDGTTKKIVVK